MQFVQEFCSIDSSESITKVKEQNSRDIILIHISLHFLYKLHTHFNVSGRLFLYLVSFLPKRKARITVNDLDLIGEWIDSDHGTSAGTILGAILFLVYVHDTPPGIQPKFADDLAASVSGKDVASVQHDLQNRLDELDKWSEEWNMRLNTSKMKEMTFTRQDK